MGFNFSIRISKTDLKIGGVRFEKNIRICCAYSADNRCRLRVGERGGWLRQARYKGDERQLATRAPSRRSKMIYERDVSHCSPTKYARDVTIKEVLPADNSDNLDRVVFDEIGWNAIAKRGVHQPGEVVFFIPPESVLPLELSEALGVTKYLSKGRVKAVKLRGNRSEGLIVEKTIAEVYLDHILQWEDPPTIHMSGEQLPYAEIPVLAFPEFVKIPNLLNEPDTFHEGESVWVSEKIHGTNTRFGVHPHPETGEATLYVGSHKTVLRETENNVYWQAVRKNVKAELLPVGVTFYGEIYGKGIQDLHYDASLELRVFGACENGGYISVERLKELCKLYDIPTVDFSPVEFRNLEQAREWADLPSNMTQSHVREGVVILARDTRGDYRSAKVIGMSYLTRAGSKTERH